MSIRYLIIHFLFVLSSIVELQAQEKIFKWIQYGKEQGLISNRVYDMVEDEYGMKWLATDKGVVRFDGTYFESFEDEVGNLGSLYRINAVKLYVDRKKNIWVGTNDQGVFLIDPSLNRVIQFHHRTDDTTSMLSNGKVRCFFEDSNDHVWICHTGYGFSKFNYTDSSFHRVKINIPEVELKKDNSFQLHFQSAVIDKQSSQIVWIATGHGLCQLNTNTEKTIYFEPKEQGGKVFFLDLISDDNGVLWLASWSLGLFKFDPKTVSFTRYSCNVSNEINPYQTCSNIWSITKSRIKNELILCTRTKGLVTFDIEEEKFEYFSEPPSQIILRQYLEDKNGVKWILTGNGNEGFFRLRQVNGIRKVRVEGNVLKVAYNTRYNHFYAITREGRLYELDSNGNVQQSYVYRKPLKKLRYGFMDMSIDSSGTIWILGKRDIYLFNPNKGRIERLGWKDWMDVRKKVGYYWNIVMDSKQDVWISAQEGGIVRLDKSRKAIQIYNYIEGDSTSLRHNYSVGSLTMDHNGYIWANSSNSIFYYKENCDCFINYPDRLYIYQEESELTPPVEFAPVSADTMLVIFSLNQIVKTAINGNRWSPLIRLKTKVKLPSVKVNASLLQGSDSIWLASDIGLTLLNLTSGQVYHYGELFDNSELNSIIRNPMGKLWVGSKDFIYKVNPKLLKQPNREDKPIIVGVQVNGAPYLSGLNPKEYEEVIIHPDDYMVSFTFSDLDYQDNGRRFFSYKLEGIDNGWINAGERRSVSYNHLPDGRYTFKVRARSNTTDWSKATATLRVIVKGPYWRQWWFWILLGLLVIAMVRWLTRIRIQRVKDRERLRAKFNQQLAELEMKALHAQMNPHFLFNSLNAIKFYIIRKDKEKAADYLTNFAMLIRRMLKNSSHQLIPLSVDIDTLELYIKIEKLRFDNEFDYKITIDPILKSMDLMIPPMLFQPFVENAIWHGLMHKKEGRGLLSIGFFVKGNSIECIIEDNGVGRAKAKEIKSRAAQRNKSMGIQITQNRMNMSKILNQLDFHIKIIDLFEDGNPSGTRVLVTIEGIMSQHKKSKRTY